MAKDPACGMDVDEKTAQWKSEYKGQVYYFCAPGCKRDFDKEPDKYVGKAATQGARHYASENRKYAAVSGKASSSCQADCLRWPN